MANAQVVTVCSHVPTQSYYHYAAFTESLRRFAEVPTVLGFQDGSYNGLMTKPLLYRNWLRAGNNTSDRLILVDCFDLVFQKHPHDVGDRCKEYFGDAIVFNAEVGLWPRGDLQEQYDGLTSESKWRYLNSGFICGPADKILALLESIDIDGIGLDRTNPDGSKTEPNDQAYMQEHFLQQVVPMVIDSGCKVSQTFSGCAIDEWDFSGPLIRNIATDTEPGVLHCNGGSKYNGILDAIIRKYDLP